MPKGYPKDVYPHLYEDEATGGDAPPLIANEPVNTGTSSGPKYKTTTKASAMRTSSTTPKIDESVQQLMTTIGVGLMVMGAKNPKLVFDGEVFVNKAEETGKAVDEIARRNPKVKVALERMFEVGAYGSIIAVGMSIVIPIAANHGVFPKVAAGFFLPEGMEIPPDPEAPEPPPTGLGPNPAGESWVNAEDDETP